jgi:phosphohistidine phosphatase
MNLLIWRHADSAPGTPDESRPLTALGVHQAKYISAWIKENVPGPYRVFGSPALRARQTAAELVDHYEAVDDFQYHSELATGIAVLNHANWPTADITTIFVGHQPNVGRVNSLLHSGMEQDANMEGGSLWWFSSDHDNKNKLALLRMAVSANADIKTANNVCQIYA